jgi:uncharacterized membrane protein
MNIYSLIDPISIFLFTYGVVQVLAQDLGIESSKKQRRFVKFLPIQILILASASYITSEKNVNITVLIIVVYYLLKILDSKFIYTLL